MPFIKKSQRTSSAEQHVPSDHFRFLHVLSRRGRRRRARPQGGGWRCGGCARLFDAHGPRHGRAARRRGASCGARVRRHGRRARRRRHPPHRAFRPRDGLSRRGGRNPQGLRRRRDHGGGLQRDDPHRHALGRRRPRGGRRARRRELRLHGEARGPRPRSDRGRADSLGALPRRPLRRPPVRGRRACEPNIRPT